ncbi:MAG: TlpA disulfide reductase family protein [Comamonadaceae bacterium]|nr:TlpA disulfide reductase family protein [Comamonadaceae bacterium]
MHATITLGPLVLPAQLLLLALCVAAGLGWARWRSRRHPREEQQALSRTLHQALWLGLLAARLGFVLQYHQAYLAHPWSVIDIRDGGWSPWAGLMAAWFYAMLATAQARQRQRRLIAPLAAASLLWLAGQAALLWQAPALRSLPAFTAPSLQGQMQSLQCLRGQPAVVNLWASWCPHCRNEMPLLAQAQAEHPQVQFVYVNQGETAQSVARFLRKHRLPIAPVWLDAKGELARHYGQPGLPLTLFFDASGQLASSRVGALSAASLQQRIQALRHDAPPGPRMAAQGKDC